MNERRVTSSCARALALCGVLALACKPEPHGEVLVVVDTDLPVSRLIGRLRVDAYTSRGFWFDSRDIARPDPLDWPASFSVHLPDEEETSVLLRLRAYPEGRKRDYLGERFSDPVFVEPFVPHSVEEMCANAPKLELGHTITVRRGREPILPDLLGGDCDPWYMAAGSAAAYVDVVEAGRYRFAAVARQPDEQSNRAAQVSLQLKSDCADRFAFIECMTGLLSAATYSSGLPDFTVNLQPGRYWLVVGGNIVEDGPADVTLAAAREDLFEDIERVESPAEPGVPLLLRNDPVATPATEPVPQSTIDRLLVLRLEHGEVGTAHVTLRGACAGTMAMLGADGLPSIESAQTCVDGDGARVSVSEVKLDAGLTRPAAGATEQGSFPPEEPCEPPNQDSPVVCVPGGVFLLGDRGGEIAWSQHNRTVPELPARMPRFFIDRYEVTVARWRAAVDQGFSPAAPFPHSNQPTPHGTNRLCSWTPEPGAFEDRALSCLNWYAARAFCIFSGGDLPTEAQWEHVASFAGRSAETAFPWGDEPPSCHCAGDAAECHSVSAELLLPSVNAQGQAVFVPGVCYQGSAEAFDAGSVPAPTAQGGLTGDRSAEIGVVGLAGGLSEWTRDSFHRYDAPCWSSAPVLGPWCWEEEAPLRTYRGGNFGNPLPFTTAAARYPSNAAYSSPAIGFRCVYEQFPSP